MNQEQEIKLKAFELAVAIIGVSSKRSKIETLTDALAHPEYQESAAETADEILNPYRALAVHIEQEIQSIL